MASNRSRTLIIAVGGTGLEILSRTRKGFEDAIIEIQPSNKKSYHLADLTKPKNEVGRAPLSVFDQCLEEKAMKEP